MPDPRRLHLGCGFVHLEGWLNADYHQTSATDVVFDLMQPWPLEDNSVRVIYASHVLEHLQGPRTFFREAWRVLEPVGSALVVRVPYGGNTAAWADWTHVRPWYPASFAGVQPGYGEAVHNPQSVGETACFGIATLQVRLSARLAPVLRIPGVRRLVRSWIAWVPEALEEIFVQAYPLKTVDHQQEYARGHHPNEVPVEYVIYQHDLRVTGCPSDKTVLVPL